MTTQLLRTYIDLHGPIKVTHQSGQFITLIADLDDLENYIVKESTDCVGIYIYECDHGVIVHRGEHPHEGFYTFDTDTLAKLNTLRLNDLFEYQLRHLLPATEAQVKHYSTVSREISFGSGEAIDVRVYGLADHTFTQTQRGGVIVCPIRSTGIESAGHRIQGYMYSAHDSTIKFDTIQAWRMRQLTRDELIAFDPRWGELVK